MIQKIEDSSKKEDICKTILKQLPEWFEMPESILDYAKKSRELPMWADIENEDVRGFVVLKENSPYAAEIYVMGVLKSCHRLGIGRALFKELYRYAQEAGYEFLQVKTVQEGHYADYDKTNAFYKGIGFRELECMPIWDDANPCQVYVMAVKKGDEMSRELIQQITYNTEVTFYNMEVAMKTCDWDYEICGTPVWRYMYHTLHSCDRWYDNPFVFQEPEIHVPNLDKVDLECDRVLTEEELWGYYNQVKEKTMSFVASLSDADLYAKPEKCDRTRMDLIYAQLRHFNVHIGIFNGITIAKKGKYPMVIGGPREDFEKNKGKLYDE
nr:GNAT family N-acetyltransferase [Eubacterium sp.]